MRKVHSGLILIGIGVVLNVVGRLLSVIAGEQQGVGVAGVLLLLMLASVVIGIFGIVRLVVGLITKS